MRNGSKPTSRGSRTANHPDRVLYNTTPGGVVSHYLTLFLILREAGTFTVGPQIIVQFAMHEKVSGDVAERAKPRNHAIKREISPKAGKLAAPGKFWA